MEEGKTLKGYELRERIGSGGFGVVYRAYQTTVGREVAIKIILPHFANQPDFIRRFETEAQIVARLEHPHIVPLYDYWRDPDGAFLVMRWLRGGSLRDKLKEGPLELETAAQILDQIASALDLAHRHHVVHRDLKPANVLLDEDSNAYLSDFGIAKDVGDPQGGQTVSGMIVGSPDYLAPEQARSDQVTPQTDIYSLGVMLYEMLIGEHPFPDKTPVERMYKHLNDPLPQVSTLPDDVRSGVNAIIQKATAKNPAHRYTSILEMAAAFREETALSFTQAGGTLVEQLTLREQEILQLIIDGCSNQEIAQRLFVTVATVKWHLWQLYRKLRVRSRVQAIVRARELNLVISDTAVEPAEVEATYVALPEPENPYKGLRSFEAADARDFFGREKLVQKLLRRLGDNHKISRFLAVVGPSGSGKSSVVKAGLVPALWRGDLPGSDRWFIVEMVPGTRPLDELEVALTRIAATYADNLRQHLERDENGLLRVAGLILPNDNSELVIVVDQFEEVFTLVQDESTRAHFLKLLHAAVTDPRSRMRVIVTLRADFYDRPLHYPEVGELVRSHMETVLPLSADELEAAVVKPAERVGVSFEPGLAATIIADSHYQPGALPLLQYALTELFEQREGRVLTQKAYQALGGAVGALAQRADEIYLEQSSEGREAVHQMFLRLVTLGEDAEDTRRRVHRSELLGVAADSETMDEIIDTFAAYRLLTLDHDPVTHSPTVEMAHEAILREWARLRSWLDTSRHDIRQQRILSTATVDWFRAGKDASYLLHGARLDQFAGWAAETSLALTPKEREFLETGLAQQAREEESERERQARELALAHQAAESAQRAEISQRRAANRLRSLAAGLIVFLVAAVALSLFAFGKQRDAEDARATSESNARLAANSAAQAQELALVNGAQMALAKGDSETALALAVVANRVPYPSAQAQVTLSEAAYPPGITRRLVGAGGIINAKIGPDGRRALTGGTGAVWWDLTTGEPIYRFENHKEAVVDVDISSDGNTGLSISRDRTIILWNLENGQMIRQFGSDLILGPEGLAAVFSPDGHTVLSNNGGMPLSHPGEEANLILWDVATGQPIRIFKGHTGLVGALAFSPDGSQALSGAWMGEMILWDVATGEILERFSENSSDWRKLPSDLLFSPDGRFAFAQGADGVLVEWDLETFTPIRHIGPTPGEEGFSWSQIALSLDGRFVVITTATLNDEIWNVEMGTLVVTLPQGFVGVAFSPDGRTVLTGAGNGFASGDVLLWDWQNGSIMQQFMNDSTVSGIAGITLSPDGNTLLVTTWSDPITSYGPCQGILYDVRTGREIRRFGEDLIPAGASWCELWKPIFSPTGDKIAMTGNELIQIVDAKTGKRLQTLALYPGWPWTLAFSPDGRTLVAGFRDGLLVLWDADTGQEIRRMIGHEARVKVAGFSPDGRLIFSLGDDHRIILWDVLTGQEIRRFEDIALAEDAVFTPDGYALVTAGPDGQIIFREAVTGQVIRTLVAPEGIDDIAISRDGRYLFCSTNTALLQWDLATSSPIRRYPFPRGFALSPEGRSVFTCEENGLNVVQRRIDSLDELMTWTLSHRRVRELTCDERTLYQVKPLCNNEAEYPTRTPYLTALPTVTSTVTPTMLPPLLSSAATGTPSVTPRPLLIAQVGEQHGEVSIGEDQMWQYSGRAGEILTIRVNADQETVPSQGEETLAGGMLDTCVMVVSPSGTTMNVYMSSAGLTYDPPQSDDINPGVNTDSMIDGMVLPEDGVYQIIVRSAGYKTGGAYTLIIESTPPGS